jgi:hypothetical protein
VTGLVALRANVLTFAIEEVPIGDAEGYVATPTLRFPGRVHPRLPSSDAMGIEGFKRLVIIIIEKKIPQRSALVRRAGASSLLKNACGCAAAASHVSSLIRIQAWEKDAI